MSIVEPNDAGTVVTLWRYPVKSMRGEELNAAEITSRGMAGDRGHAVIDTVTGKIASAKHPKKWGRLFDCRALLTPAHTSGHEGGLYVMFPDGTWTTGGSADIDERLSSILGRAVRLATAAPAAPQLEEYWPDIPGAQDRTPSRTNPCPRGPFSMWRFSI
jgi:uncharacterized protein YcbX